MTYQYAPTIHNKWCYQCDSEKATYRVTYRTDRHLPKWTTPNGEKYVAEVCLDCYRTLGEQEERGEIWGTSTTWM